VQANSSAVADPAGRRPFPANTRFLALATDYDGTLATEGRVEQATLQALARLKATGKRLILVTGREAPQLREVFPHIAIFDSIVAENGALLLFPSTGEERLIAAEPPPAFISTLRERGVEPLSIGRSIVATTEPHADAVEDTIDQLGLDWRVILNKESVMCLPAGVDKASGLSAALERLQISAQSVVGIGDAENDHAFLELCGYAVAVGNALPALQEAADMVTTGEAGAGVVELIDLWLGIDPRALS
jgi:HAD superfamily hydrolase (TIGR01484 family)